ncbi:MAG: DUF1499 domain-containing protein [Gemmatimonadota bacterium]
MSDTSASTPPLRRWLCENAADTRAANGPDGRIYTAPFARTWDALRRDVAARRGWSLAHADEDLGMLTVRCRSPVFRFVDDLTIWVILDENGLTRVEARSCSRTGRGDFGVNRRRIVRLLQRLDRRLGQGARIAGRGETARTRHTA